MAPEQSSHTGKLSRWKPRCSSAATVQRELRKEQAANRTQREVKPLPQNHYNTNARAQSGNTFTCPQRSKGRPSLPRSWQRSEPSATALRAPRAPAPPESPAQLRRARPAGRSGQRRHGRARGAGQSEQGVRSGQGELPAAQRSGWLPTHPCCQRTQHGSASRR